jgi:hypothetical protein
MAVNVLNRKCGEIWARKASSSARVYPSCPRVEIGQLGVDTEQLGQAGRCPRCRLGNVAPRAGAIQLQGADSSALDLERQNQRDA